MMSHRPNVIVHTAYWLLIVLCLVVTVLMQAPTASADDVSTRTLPARQVEVIRGISRNVLGAKQSGRSDPAVAADAAQLEQLRVTVDTLIAHDIDPGDQPQIAVEGTESGPQRQTREENRARHTAERSQARNFAAKIKGRKAQMASRAQAAADESTGPMKRAMAAQRIDNFEKWGSKLEAAAAEDNPNRVAQLRELQKQLRATRGELTDAPLAHGTPTLQAMPAGFVPPKNNGPVTGESRSP